MHHNRQCTQQPKWPLKMMTYGSLALATTCTWPLARPSTLTGYLQPCQGCAKPYLASPQSKTTCTPRTPLDTRCTDPLEFLLWYGGEIRGAAASSVCSPGRGQKKMAPDAKRQWHHNPRNTKRSHWATESFYRCTQWWETPYSLCLTADVADALLSKMRRIILYLLESCKGRHQTSLWG